MVQKGLQYRLSLISRVCDLPGIIISDGYLSWVSSRSSVAYALRFGLVGMYMIVNITLLRGWHIDVLVGKNYAFGVILIRPVCLAPDMLYLAFYLE